jgi:hypothetical protein
MAKGDITPQVLSSSTDGRQVKVDATSTPGTLLHTVASGTSTIEFITLEAANTSSSAVNLTIEWGGTTDPDDHIELSVPANRGAFVVIDKRRLQNGLAVRAFASVADVIVMYGESDKVEL